MPRIPQNRSELEAHLEEQLRFLRSSCAAYDAGDISEAKRVAATIRLLLHDGGSSDSLLGQLGLKGLAFVDGGDTPSPRNLLATAGLTGLRISRNDAVHLPKFALGAGPHPPALRTFAAWWTRPAIVDNERVEISRKDLVLAMANMDGGAHVDRSMDRTYARLSRQNSIGWVAHGPTGSMPILGVEFASVRQIAWEIEETLRLRQPAPVDEALFRCVGRNDPCPCNSGAKFKKCHGRPA